jgi:sulfite dehydrogenase (quinone) subunit SoeC
VNPAYSVLLFTTASGAGYGLLSLLCVVGMNHGQASSMAFALVSCFVALALITVGLLSSTLHLGHPERAWRAFSQWRTSWLSREGVAAVATFAPALVFAATWSGLVEAQQFIMPSAMLTIFLTALTVICTGMIYASLKTIRAWNHPLTVPVYCVFALATGAALLLLFATIFDRYQIFQLILAIVTLIAIGILKFIYWRMIDSAERTYTMGAATGLGDGVRQWEVPHTAKNFIQKEMGFVVARKHATKLRKLFFALLFGTLLAYLACLINPWFSLIAAPAIMLAAWVERWLFFAEAEHVVTLFYGNQKA